MLKDGQTVEESKIKSGTVVHLFQRPPKAALPVASAVPAGTSVTNPLHGSVATATPAGSEAVVGAAVAADGVVAIDGVAGNAPDPALAFMHDIEMVEARRRVKLLASILLLISGLNVVTDFVEVRWQRNRWGLQRVGVVCACLFSTLTPPLPLPSLRLDLLCS